MRVTVLGSFDFAQDDRVKELRMTEAKRKTCFAQDES
jgi:hypothetical protein